MEEAEKKIRKFHKTCYFIEETLEKFHSYEIIEERIIIV